MVGDLLIQRVFVGMCKEGQVSNGSPEVISDACHTARPLSQAGGDVRGRGVLSILRSIFGYFFLNVYHISYPVPVFHT